MNNGFSNERLDLLKFLLDLVKENLDNCDINVDLERDVAEFLADFKDKRRVRKLKKVKRALNKWIEEMKEEPSMKEAVL